MGIEKCKKLGCNRRQYGSGLCRPYLKAERRAKCPHHYTDKIFKGYRLCRNCGKKIKIPVQCRDVKKSIVKRIINPEFDDKQSKLV